MYAVGNELDELLESLDPEDLSSELWDRICQYLIDPAVDQARQIAHRLPPG